MSLIVRPATEADIPAIREIACATWPHAYVHILSARQLGYMLHQMYHPQTLATQMADGSQTFLMAMQQDEPVGFAAYGPEAPPIVWKLHKLYVLPFLHGKGAGKMLLQHAERNTMEAGGEALRLQVNRENEAIGFYQRMGYNIIQSADFDIGHGFLMQDFIMAKKLKS